MRYIDLETWSRREQFKLFNTLGFPHFSLSANVDLTVFYPVVKQRGATITVGIVYLLSRVANEIPEFRYRIRGDRVVEHKVIHPSITIPTGEDLFGFCTMDYFEDFSEFAVEAAEKMAYLSEYPTLEDEPGQDNLLFMTAIPWVSFTSFMHPTDLNPADSVPRIAWGRFFKDGDNLKMPLNVQAHHALMDGVHMGKYFEKVQDYLNRPDFILGGE